MKLRSFVGHGSRSFEGQYKSGILWGTGHFLNFSDILILFHSIGHKKNVNSIGQNITNLLEQK